MYSQCVVLYGTLTARRTEVFLLYSGASSNLAPLGSKQNCRLKQSVGLSNSVYRENREMGARKTAGLSRDSAYEGAGLAASLLYVKKCKCLNQINYC